MASDRRHDPYPSDEEIAELAYEMFLHKVTSSRRVADYWRQAESELLERAAARVIGRGDSRSPRRTR